MSSLHHVALTVDNFEWYLELFEKLGMHIKRTKGEAPERQLWFAEGIQLCESAELTEGNIVGHVALDCESIPDTLAIALAHGCIEYPKGEKWFRLPNGVVMELMPLE